MHAVVHRRNSPEVHQAWESERNIRGIEKNADVPEQGSNGLFFCHDLEGRRRKSAKNALVSLGSGSIANIVATDSLSFASPGMRAAVPVQDVALKVSKLEEEIRQWEQTLALRLIHKGGTHSAIDASGAVDHMKTAHYSATVAAQQAQNEMCQTAAPFNFLGRTPQNPILILLLKAPRLHPLKDIRSSAKVLLLLCAHVLLAASGPALSQLLRVQHLGCRI